METIRGAAVLVFIYTRQIHDVRTELSPPLSSSTSFQYCGSVLQRYLTPWYIARRKLGLPLMLVLCLLCFRTVRRGQEKRD